MDINKIICFLCNKEIINSDQKVRIGKDKLTKKELFRHDKCIPTAKLSL